MAIFPIIEADDSVQIADKTRITVTNSFTSDGTTITAYEVKPSKNDSYVTVTTNRYLDWAYASFTVDVDATNNKLDFKEGSGAELTATLSSGAYTLSALAAEIKTRMDAAGALTYTVSVTDDKFTISAASGFSLLVGTGTHESTSIFSHIGFTGDDLTGLATYTGDMVRSVTKEITVRITAGSTATLTQNITVFSEDGDQLYATDGKLKTHEPSIIKYLPAGKVSFKYIHRRAQELILAWLDKEGYTDIYDNKYTKDSLVLTDEVTEWATFVALRLIFEGISNATDDIFGDKAKRYKGMEVEARKRAVLRLDTDGDGTVDTGEQVNIRDAVVVRR